MHYYLLLALPILAAAVPTPELDVRAGAPNPIQVPADCPIITSGPRNHAKQFEPTTAYTSANLLYSYALNPGSTSPDGTDDSVAVKQCLNTCYGYGNPGDCTAIWTGHGVNFSAYGTTYKAEFVCKLFKGGMNPKVLGPPQNGNDDRQAHAFTIGCGPRPS